MFIYSPRLFRPPVHASYACQADSRICSSREPRRRFAPILLELNLPPAATGMENGILRGSARAAHDSGPSCASVRDDNVVGGSDSTCTNEQC
jgi:hypothetical protein